VLLKNFMRDGERLETRVWMNHTDAGWVGYSYRWDAGGGDATLADEAGEDMPISGGLESWEIPARGACVQCHEPGPAQNLGLQLTQLDREFTYPTTGRTANQLDTFVALGLLKLEAAMRPTDTSPKLVDYRDDSQPTDQRARSYLHANCSSCHKRTDGYCTGDFRVSATGAKVGVCNVTAKYVDPSWGWPQDIKLIAPGNPEQSALWLRLSAPPGSDMSMPPLGHHEIDQEGVELIAAWITSMDACEK
jgi:mono/diheme cytochrome c family protein